ncbi:DnaJ like protein subfamily C member 14 [Myotis brandtii]|uniref:DnaJ like protein subfamily C member 14 n=1 Tax=Myotis brandtii TaxID=109478 RepID=S7PTG9_MYOBR|nr:DnaJ like protein subfamily C member 14 [Myotis brandtii]
MAQKHPGERQSCGAHHSGGASLGTLGPSLDPEILSFSGLRDSARPAPNGTRCLTKHSSPKYTQPPNPAHWSDPSHGPPRGPGPPRNGEDPDQSEASSEEESGVDQELSRENEAGHPEDENPSFLSIPSACNCQGTPGIPEEPYSGGGDNSSSNFCHHCMSPALGEHEELEEEYDDEEPKFPSDFSRVPSGKKPPPRRQRHRVAAKDDTWEGGRRDPRSPGRHRLGRKRSQADKRRGLGLWGAEELCQLGQAGFWWLIELLVLVGEYVETCGHLIYACRQLKGSDLDLFRVWAGVWAGRLGGWAQVHPDKNHHPRAEEAFKVLRAAWDIVSNPERRKEYEMKRMAENELSRSVNEFLSKLQDDLKEAMNTMMCSRCQGKHRRFEMDREPKSARYCAECNRLHPAEEGDFWAESSMLGLKITYFALMDGKVYDITEWAGCQRVGISPDTHRVPYHISFGSRIPGTSGRQRATPDAPPADLQDFLNRIFQVPPGQMSNGNFFAAHPGPGATGASKPNSTVPKGEAKPKRRKKVRRPFQR